MARFTRHLQPAKASIAALALLGLALSPGSTLELHRGPSPASMQQTLMVYPSDYEPLVFAEETPGGFDDERVPLVPQGEEEDLQQPPSPQEEGLAGQQQEAPLSPPEEARPAQQQAPKRSRAARLKAGLKKAVLYIPRKLRKFYQKMKGGTKNLWKRLRARFGRRRGEKPQGPPARPLQRGRAATYRRAAPEAPSEGIRRTLSLGAGLPRDLSSPWKSRTPPKSARLRRRRSASLGVPPPETQLARRRRSSSMGGGRPADLSSPWSVPAAGEEFGGGEEGMMSRGGEGPGTSEEDLESLEGPGGARLFPFGDEGEEAKGGMEGGAQPLSPLGPSTAPSETEESPFTREEGEGEGFEGMEGTRPGEQPAAVGAEEEAAFARPIGAMGGEERGAVGGGAAAAAEGRQWPVRISPSVFPLTNVVLVGEMKQLSAKAESFPLLFRALHSNHEHRTARRLSVLLPANRITPRLALSQLENMSPALMVDGSLSITLENAYRTAQATLNSLWFLVRSKVALVLEPAQMSLIDELMRELALALQRLDEAQSSADARAIVAHMKVDFPRLARKLKTFFPILMEAFKKSRQAAQQEQDAMIELMDATNALVERHRSTPSTNSYAHSVLIPGLKLAGGRAACDLIHSRLLTAGLEGFEKILQKHESSWMRWMQTQWIQKISKFLWKLRDPTRVADKITIDACSDYRRQQETQEEQIFPWFARLPHITARKLLVE
ncbi:hypothetical protein Emed_004948 [Eimeria media]